MAGAPRPLKWSAERAERVLQAIRDGLTYEHAALSAGISVDTLASWRKGKQGADSNFSERFLQAEAEAVLLLMRDVRVADDWRAKAWILEHRWPQHYGKQVHELQGKDGADLTFTLTLDRPAAETPDDGR